MFSKIFSATAVALAASSLVSAQTFTTCDPTKKDCAPDPALGGSVTLDLTKGHDDSVLYPLAGTTIAYNSGGAVFTIDSDTDAPTMASHKYIFFGKLEVKMKAAPGVGIVTSIVLQSDDLDEIDWEWLGGDNTRVQTNYFSKGDTSTYDRGATHQVNSPVTEYHTYTIDWTKDSLKWIINGAVVRELLYADAKGGASYPQTPMQIKIGSWIAGKPGAPQGTIDWAGGLANFANAPFNAYYESITITDYQGGKEGAKEYVYGDRSGTWQSIVVKTEGGSSGGDKSTTTPAAPPKTTTTKAPESTKTTLSTVVTSASTESVESVSTSVSSSSTSTTIRAPASQTSSGTVAAAQTSKPAAGVMTKANLALGAVGLFFAFML